MADQLPCPGEVRPRPAAIREGTRDPTRLLTRRPSATVESYNTWHSTPDQGKYARAQLLHEKALEIRRRHLPLTRTRLAVNYNNLASNLTPRGKYAQAQPLFEKALEIFRRLLTDDHPDTATSYDNLAVNLHAQGK